MIKIPIPASISDCLNNYWQAYIDACAQKNIDQPKIGNSSFKQIALTIWGMSDFVAKTCIRYPELILDLFTSDDIHTIYPPRNYSAKLSALFAEVNNESQLIKTIRQFRCREMLRIAWRDLSGTSDFHNTSQELSELADTVIEQCLTKLHTWHCKQYGFPLDKHKTPQQMLVIAVGKLGGYELNFSSDIDLMFAYPTVGQTDHNERPITNQQYFTRLGQRLIHVLNHINADGYVFRVDMRLRPYGTSGPLVMNIAALHNYYQEHSRDWERYALIKARVVCGDPQASRELINIFHNFVYRPYTDHSVVETLREMKSLIREDVLRNKLNDDIKQGPGGIREVEFIVQTQQLIFGGRYFRLQKTSLLPVLNRLGELNILNPEITQHLEKNYIFLRNIENRLQMYADQQIHKLPTDLVMRERLAFSAGFSHWDELSACLQKIRQYILDLFLQGTAEPNAETLPLNSEVDASHLRNLWGGKMPPQQAIRLLSQLGFTDEQECMRLMSAFREKVKKQLLSWYARKRLLQVGPQLLLNIGKTEAPLTTLKRLFRLLESLIRRSSYLVVLLENPNAQDQLIQLCAASPWIAAQLISLPNLLEELRDSRNLYAPLDIATLTSELTQNMAEVSPDNLDQQMSLLRYFKQAQVLRVASSDITGKLPLMKVSDHLTNTASVILQQVSQIAWRHMVEKYDEPLPELYNQHNTGLIIIGYGKLGGIELGYSSDLDLVFLYDDAAPFKFYSRMAQLIIHILSQRTATGVLYEVDTRLRPSGSAGMLVTSISAFREYQLEQAWTWEHQALVRARVICGSKALQHQFTQIRNEVLSKERDTVQLQHDIIHMRARMRQANKKPPADTFDLKQGKGGIADIEFLVQYCVLLWAVQHPSLLTYPDNIRILESFADVGLMPNDTTAALCQAYRDYRERVHHLDLQKELPIVANNEFLEYRDLIQGVWRKYIGNYTVVEA